MASKSLGTLTIDLIAKVGGFTSGMEKAQRASDKWAKQVQKDAAATSAAILSVGGAIQAAAVTAGTAGFALLKTTSEQINATDQWAKSLKMSTQELLAWQFAAEKAGVAGDNMADIFKDLSDKIGDAVLNKSGEAVDALNALGLSAERLSKVSPDKQMLAIGEALGKISSNAGKVTILESLGNDLSKLLPLFDNNNAKLNQFIQLAKDYGVAPDPASIDDLVKVNDLFQDMEAQVRGLKMEIAAGLAGVDLSPLNNSLKEIHNVLTDPEVLKGLVSMVSQVAELAGWLIKAAAAAGELASTSGNRMAALGGGIDTKDLGQVEERIKYLDHFLAGRKGFYGQGESFFGWVTGKDDSVKAMTAELEGLIKVRDELQAKPESTLPVMAATVGSSQFALPPGQTNGKAAVDTGAKKLESAFRAMEQSYLRQIALADTSGKKTVEITEQQKLQFDLAEGKLSGINDIHRQRLMQLAQEVDRLNAVRKANEENAKVAAYVANLAAQNDNARATAGVELQGAGLGDKERGRLKERLSIERDFLDQQRELQKQYQGGEISKSVYDRETQALREAQSERLRIQENYYQQVDALQADWIAGAQDGYADWLDEISDVSGAVSSGVKSSLNGVFDNVTSMLEGNKVSWKSWGISVLQIIAKVALQMAAVNALSSVSSSSGLLGSLIGGVASAVAGGAAGAGGTTPSGAYTSAASNLTFNAKGGVYASSDLSQYSGSVVSSPTLFAFAKGAGLMGEAGPEAIMPLTRAADGSLGVRAVKEGSAQPQGAGSGVQVNIHFDGNGNAQSGTSGGAEDFGRQIGSYVEQKYRELMRRDSSPGGPLWNLAKGSR